MGGFNALVTIGMEVSEGGFSWVDAYVACRCSTADYTPLSNVSWRKLVGAFCKVVKEI